MWTLLLTRAFAAEPAHGGSAPSGTASALAILLMVGAAYVFTHFVVNRLQRRYLFVSGFEYILLGVLLGPVAADAIVVFEDLGRLAPVIVFACGWIGLLYGMELNFRAIVTEGRQGALRIALADAVGPAAAVTGSAYAFFVSGLLFEPVRSEEAWCAAGALGCAAAASSNSAIDLVADAYRGLGSRLLPTLRHAARIGDLLAIGGLGALFCAFHPDVSNHAVLNADPWWWGWATLGLGIFLGMLFSAFLGTETDEQTRLLALVGIIVFSAGASFMLQISALTVNLLLGVMLVNSRHGRPVAATLERSLKPVTLVLMVFAGAMWTPVSPIAAVVVSLGYLLVRTAAKALSLTAVTLGTPLRRDLFRGLMAQGDVAVAIAVSFRIVYSGPAVDLAFTAILVSVMLNELAAPRLLKGLLIDAGELDSDARSWSTQGSA